MTRTPLVAGALSILMVVSVLAVGGTASGSQSAKELTECTTITESGTYELTDDIEYGIGVWHCIKVEADDVTIDGNGYSFNNTASDDTSEPMGHAIIVQEQHNITVRDVTFTDTASVHVDDSTAVTVENTLFHDDLRVKYSEDVTIRDTHFATEWVDVVFRHSDGVHLVNNHIDIAEVEVETKAKTANVTARDNYGDGSLSITVSAGEALIENNTLPIIGVMGGEGTRVEATRNNGGSNRINVVANGVARVHNNTVDGGTLLLGGRSDDFIATHNTVTNSDLGVIIGYGSANLRFTHNRITNNDIGIRTSSDIAEIHQNDLSGNSEYGIIYTQDFGVVNATQNYWGDRPSSPDEEHAPFEDPETGTLANGSGAAVSKAARTAGDDPGISNIHFDPWLDTAPDAGVVEEGSDNDDSNDETTTTTTTTTTTATSTTTTNSTTTSTTTTTTEDTTTTTPTTRTTTSGDKTGTAAGTTDNSGTTTDDEPTTATGAPTGDKTTATGTPTDDETTPGDSETTETDSESSDQTTQRDNRTPTSPEPTTTTATGTEPPATNQNTIISRTTASEAPGFTHLLGIIALLGSALLVARGT